MPLIKLIKPLTFLFKKLLPLLTISLLLSPQLSFAASTTQLTPITLQLKWTHQFQFAGYYMAKKMGYYQAAGLDVHFSEGSNKLNVVNEVLQNRAQFGTGTSGLLLNFNQGDAVTVLGVIFQHSAEALLSLDSSHIRTPLDFKNKTVMLDQPKTSELLAFLQKAHVQHHIKIIQHSGDIRTILENKADIFDIYSTTEPYFLAKKGIPYHIFSPRSLGIDFYGDNLFTSQTYAKDHPEIVESFRDASFKGWQYAMSHIPETINVILNRYPANNTSESALAYEAEEMQQLMRTDLIKPGYMTQGRWEHIIQTYQDLDLLSPYFNPKGFLYEQQFTLNKTYQQLQKFILITALLAALLLLLFWLTFRYHKLSRHHHLLVKKAPIAIILLNNKGIILEWNQQATLTFGWHQEEAIHKPLLDLLIPQKEFKQKQDALKTLLTTSQQQIWYCDSKTNTKTLLPCQWIISPLEMHPKSNILCMIQPMPTPDKYKPIDAKNANPLQTTTVTSKDPAKNANIYQDIVKAIKLSILVWEETTGHNKAKLAERSGLWTVSLDKGIQKTRTLDKYTSIDTIPTKPRFNVILKTIHFVLSNTNYHIKKGELIKLKEKILDYK